MRSRSPSTTWRLTRTVSPGWNGGTGRVGGQLRDLLGFELLQEVHRSTSLVIAARRRSAPPTWRRHRSGRRSRVNRSASRPPPLPDLRRWSPDTSTSGTARPCHSCGRVYCGYSSSPAAKLSSASVSAQPTTPGQQPHAGVDQRDRRRLAARQHEIAEAHLLDRARLDARARRPPRSGRRSASPRAPSASSRTRCLVEPPAARRQQQQRPGPAGAGDRRIEHIGPHHHPRPAAERRIVDGAVFIAREIADVHRFEPPDARPSAPCRRANRRAGPAASPGRSSAPSRARSWRRLRLDRRQQPGRRVEHQPPLGRCRPPARPRG